MEINKYIYICNKCWYFCNKSAQYMCIMYYIPHVFHVMLDTYYIFIFILHIYYIYVYKSMYIYV